MHDATETDDNDELVWAVPDQEPAIVFASPGLLERLKAEEPELEPA